MMRGTLGATSVAILAFVPNVLKPWSTDPAAPTERSRTDPVVEDADGPYLIDATNRQPILIHDVSGGTLLGPVQSSVIVWSSGDVTYSRQDPFSRAVVGSTKLPPEALASLMAGLHEAGAANLSDQWPEVADVPLNTVTVLDGKTDSSAHTFSYWISVDAYEAVDAVLDRLTSEIERAD